MTSPNYASLIFLAHMTSYTSLTVFPNFTRRKYVHLLLISLCFGFSYFLMLGQILRMNISGKLHLLSELSSKGKCTNSINRSSRRLTSPRSHNYAQTWLVRAVCFKLTSRCFVRIFKAGKTVHNYGHHCPGKSASWLGTYGLWS